MHTPTHDPASMIGRRQTSCRWLPPVESIDQLVGRAGPVALPGSGRVVWWTGKVAIGLRYEQPQPVAAMQRGQAFAWVAA